MQSEFDSIFKKWDSEEGDTIFFRYFLKKNKWKRLNSDGVFKTVFSKNDLILKYDSSLDFNKDDFGLSGERSHTASEYRLWRRSMNRPHRAKYICPAVAYHRGILIQPKLENVNKIPDKQIDSSILEIAHKLRFSHFWHFGYLKGEIKWFDVDSSGSGWYNWNKGM